MSGCENWQNTIEPYLDGELDTQPLAQFEAHLPACSACRDALEAKRWLADQLSALPKPEASPRFEARLWARLAREEDAQAAVGRPLDFYVVEALGSGRAEPGEHRLRPC